MTKLRSIVFFLLLNLALLSGLIYFFSNGIFSFLATYTNHGKSISMPDLSAMSLQEAKKKLESLGLNYLLDQSFYDPSYKANEILNFAPLAGEFIKKNREVYLQVNGNGLVLLPDVKYKEKSLAVSAIFEADLSIKNFIYLPDENKNKVLEVLFEGKILKSGDLIPYQSKVDLIIGKEKEEKILIPDLRGMQYDVAADILEKYNFTQGNIHYKEDLSSSSEKLKVYKQNPFAGEIYKPNGAIELWLSELENKQLEELIDSNEKKYRKEKILETDLKNFFNKDEEIIIE